MSAGEPGGFYPSLQWWFRPKRWSAWQLPTSFLFGLALDVMSLVRDHPNARKDLSITLPYICTYLYIAYSSQETFSIHWLVVLPQCLTLLGLPLEFIKGSSRQSPLGCVLFVSARVDSPHTLPYIYIYMSYTLVLALIP